MAKRMQDKEHCWDVPAGSADHCLLGRTCPLPDRCEAEQGNMELDQCSCPNGGFRFTGVIAGSVSIESGLSIYMILATAGISGAMGPVALTYFGERLTGIKDANQ